MSGDLLHSPAFFCFERARRAAKRTGGGSYFTRMLALGVTEEEIGEAFNEARRAGFTEATGLSADRLMEAGRARAASIWRDREAYGIT